jgi:hypothetical protein
VRSLRGCAPADGRPLRCKAHRNGRRHRLSQTLSDQPARLDCVPHHDTLSASRAPWPGLDCRGCRTCGLRGSSNLTVPILAGFAGGKPPLIRCPIPLPRKLGMGCLIRSKPAPQWCVALLRAGCLFPSGPPTTRLGPAGKRPFRNSPTAPEHDVPKPPAFAQQGG